MIRSILMTLGMNFLLRRMNRGRGYDGGRSSRGLFGRMRGRRW